MRRIERPTSFRRDYKRVKLNPHHRKNLEELLTPVLALLMQDLSLPSSNKDHSLTGNWAGYRECHLKPDLLLIYEKTDDDILRLVRLGSHSELFG